MAACPVLLASSVCGPLDASTLLAAPAPPLRRANAARAAHRPTSATVPTTAPTIAPVSFDFATAAAMDTAVRGWTLKRIASEARGHTVMAASAHADSTASLNDTSTAVELASAVVTASRTAKNTAVLRAWPGCCVTLCKNADAVVLTTSSSSSAVPSDCRRRGTKAVSSDSRRAAGRHVGGVEAQGSGNVIAGKDEVAGTRLMRAMRTAATTMRMIWARAERRAHCVAADSDPGVPPGSVSANCSSHTTSPGGSAMAEGVAAGDEARLEVLGDNVVVAMAVAVCDADTPRLSVLVGELVAEAALLEAVGENVAVAVCDADTPRLSVLVGELVAEATLLEAVAEDAAVTKADAGAPWLRVLVDELVAAMTPVGVPLTVPDVVPVPDGDTDGLAPKLRLAVDEMVTVGVPDDVPLCVVVPKPVITAGGTEEPVGVSVEVVEPVVVGVAVPEAVDDGLAPLVRLAVDEPEMAGVPEDVPLPVAVPVPNAAGSVGEPVGVAVEPDADVAVPEPVVADVAVPEAVDDGLAPLVRLTVDEPEMAGVPDAVLVPDDAVVLDGDTDGRSSPAEAEAVGDAPVNGDAAGEAPADADAESAAPTQKLVAGALQPLVAQTNTFPKTAGACASELSPTLKLPALRPVNTRMRVPGAAGGLEQ